MSSTEISRIWQIVAGSTTTASESRDKTRIARTLRWRSRLGFRDQWQSRVLGGGVEREEVVRRPISCIHDVLPPIKDHQEIRQPETDHRRESRTVHASNGVRDRIITLQTHNHERERERAGDPAACLLSELARACWRIEVRDAWNCRRERGDFLWLQLQQGSGLSLLSLVSYPVLCLGMLLYGSCSNKKSSSLSLAPNNSVIVTDVSRAGWGSPDRARARLELNPALTRRAAA
jgi:hypothetical protein